MPKDRFRHNTGQGYTITKESIQQGSINDHNYVSAINHCPIGSIASQPEQKDSLLNKMHNTSQIHTNGLEGNAKFSKVAKVGSIVRVLYLDDKSTEIYTITEQGKENIYSNTISVSSPLGSKLINHYANQILDVNTPDGTLKIQILEVL